jgi:hypothetical protein
MEKWILIEGNQPALLVAGHNAPQIREGQMKKRDWGTGNVVKYLCEKTGAFGIIATETQPDPNFYEDAPLRRKVIELISDRAIKQVLDIHGRRADYPYLIEFFVNKYFDQGVLGGEMVFKAEVKNQKLLVNSLDVPAVEVEIRRDGRTWGEENFEIVIEKLEKIIKSPLTPL